MDFSFVFKKCTKSPIKNSYLIENFLIILDMSELCGYIPLAAEGFSKGDVFVQKLF